MILAVPCLNQRIGDLKIRITVGGCDALNHTAYNRMDQRHGNPLINHLKNRVVQRFCHCISILLKQIAREKNGQKVRHGMTAVVCKNQRLYKRSLSCVRSVCPLKRICPQIDIPEAIVFIIGKTDPAFIHAERLHLIAVTPVDTLQQSGILEIQIIMRVNHNQIRACHSQMNNFGLQIAAMHHLNKKITDNIEAQAELTEMINDPERYHKYGKIRDEYFSLSNEMIDDTEDFLAKYKNAKQPEYENPVSTKLFLVGGESPEIHQENLKRIELWEKILKDKDINDSFKDNGVEFMKAVNAEFERALDPDKIDLNNL